MKIVILDGYCVNPGDLSWDELKGLGYLTVYPRTNYEDLKVRAGDADIVLTNKTMFNADNLSKLKNVKYIGILATGYNTVDLETAKKRGITVTNIPAYSTQSVAQMTFAHILNITNKVSYYADQNREGRWSECHDFCYWDATLPELKGKTIGVVGLGHTGMEVAKIAYAFGMEIFAYTSKNPKDLPYAIRKTTIDGLLSVSDILTLHCPLTDSTRELINRDSIKKMKRGAILINTGRGPLVNEKDVADALSEGLLAAYGADVMCQEPPKGGSPLFSQPNAFITPHVAWATLEARKRLIDIAYDNVKAFIDGTPQNVVSK